MDTGSADLLVYSTPCEGCAHGHRYDPAHSSSAARAACHDYECYACSNNQCGFDDRYGDGSEVSGVVYTDTIEFPGSTLHNTSVQFGAIQYSTPRFEPTGVDGIFGLGYSAISSWRGMPPFERITTQHGLPSVYSLCLSDKGGQLTVGYHAPASIQWTPVTKRQWFVIAMNDITVDGHALGFHASDFANAIVDSGTTLMYLPSKPYRTLISALENMCSHTKLAGVCDVRAGHTIFDGFCYSMTDDEVDDFPTLGLKIQGVNNVEVLPTAYLVSYQGAYCWGINDGGSGGVPTILGDVAVQNMNVVYDMQNHRVGFGAESTC